MPPIEYVKNLNSMYQSQGFPPYNWSVYEDSPWTPFNGRLGEAVVALISSAGVFRDDQEPFDPWAVNDLSFREISIDTPANRLRLHHNYFDHRDAVNDINCLFPARRLFELAAEGFIGRLASTAVSLGMGRLYKRTALMEETTPRIAEVLTEQGVDAALLVAA